MFNVRGSSLKISSESDTITAVRKLVITYP